ncbi:hypothetical protein M2163_004427 [Streptomyces sp. SAI-135]|uniref:hypothetical protein n=1 Tax=unclassified Streptomyces TaxID=2593676 RepID=UPI00247728EC|nr:MULTISPECIES: hypothetical protein [unclassified Streptomyces]MDH6518587.1 hypothetical protein [Streptomyces sp. SAI-090]MDH6617319.1 hypothetical protein [Streptomyces sp. SAI-135]
MQGIDECLLEAMRLPGARGAALVDWTSGLALGAVGESPGGDQEAAAAEAAELARLAAEQRAFASGSPGAAEPSAGSVGLDGLDGAGGSATGPAGTEPPVEDLILSNRDSYHVLRFVPTSFDSSVFLHLWLARAEGNLALARIRLGEMAGRLELG